MSLIADAPLDLRTTIYVVNALVAAFLLGVGIAAVRARRRRRVTPPNQEPYHEDDTLEGARLERIQFWALAMAALFLLALASYWIFEPERQEAMGLQFLDTSEEQGATLFAENDPEENPKGLGCAGCHGPKGEGGAAPPQIVTIAKDEVEVADGALESQDRVCAPNADDDTTLLCRVIWKAPALNTVMLRFSRDEVRDIIIYGRPGTPMPAWGLEGGGAKGDQSVENLLDYLESIQLDDDEATALQAAATDGRQLYEANCARCHTKHWSYLDTFAVTTDDDDNTVPYPLFDLFGVAGGGAFGPNLTGEVTVRQFPDIEDHVEFITLGSEFQKPYGTRGIGSGRMPGFGRMLSASQIRAIVEYERSLSPDRVKLDDLHDDLDGSGAEETETTATTTASGGGE